MTTYVDAIVQALLGKLPELDEGLARFYALLVLTTGFDTTRENVHDAWSLWRMEINPHHRSIVPFSSLSPEVQEMDTKYAIAIREVAFKMGY